MVRGVVDAWSLEPIGSLRLGGVDYPVPPLTFARFQRLLTLDAPALARAMVGDDESAVLPWLEVCMPDTPRAVWDEWLCKQMIAQLFLIFVKGHDWQFIGDAIRFGEPPDPGEAMPTKVEIASGLLATAKQSGYRIEDLLAMRVEGFYLLVESIREENERKTAAMREASGETDVPPLGVAHEQGIPPGLAALLGGADGNG